MKRANAVWNTAVKRHATRQREAEALVVRWQWVSKPVTYLEPGIFESTKKRPGKPLPKQPAKLDGACEEGFDAEGRLCVSRRHTSATEREEAFYRYLDGEIEEVVFSAGKPTSARVFAVNERGQISSYEAVDDMGRGYIYRTRRTYSFDERGFYAGFRSVCDTGDGNQVPHGFDYQCDDTGRIVRSWWMWSDARRQLYWKDKTASAATPKPKAKVTPKAKPRAKAKVKPRAKAKATSRR